MNNLQKTICFRFLIMIVVVTFSYPINAEKVVKSQDRMIRRSNQEKLPLHKIIVNQKISTDKKLELMQDVLCDESLDINAQDANGKTALNVATFYNAKPIIIQLLLTHKADVNLQDRFNETPLHNAIRKEEIMVAQILLQNGANKILKNDKLETSIDLARSPNTLALFGFEE